MGTPDFAVPPLTALLEKGHNVTPEAIKEDVELRDRTDETRKVAPLKKADDAVVIDTTDLTAAEVAQKIVNEIENRKK